MYSFYAGSVFPQSVRRASICQCHTALGVGYGTNLIVIGCFTFHITHDVHLRVRIGFHIVANEFAWRDRKRMSLTLILFCCFFGTIGFHYIIQQGITPRLSRTSVLASASNLLFYLKEKD